VKRFSCWLNNERIGLEIYFLPFATYSTGKSGPLLALSGDGWSFHWARMCHFNHQCDLSKMGLVAGLDRSKGDFGPALHLALLKQIAPLIPT